jgi:hypothetical protein
MLEASASKPLYTYPSLFGFELETASAALHGSTDSEETYRLLVQTPRLFGAFDLATILFLAFSTSNGRP